MGAPYLDFILPWEAHQHIEDAKEKSSKASGSWVLKVSQNSVIYEVAKQDLGTSRSVLY